MRFETGCFALPPDSAPERMKERVKAKVPSALVQVTSSRAARNERLVEMLAEQTYRSGQTGALLARSAEMDLLLRLAGTTQIEDAILRCGAKDGERNLLIVRCRHGEMKRIEATVLKGLVRLPSKALVKKELEVVERGALLNALRA